MHCACTSIKTTVQVLVTTNFLHDGKIKLGTGLITVSILWILNNNRTNVTVKQSCLGGSITQNTNKFHVVKVQGEFGKKWYQRRNIEERRHKRHQYGKVCFEASCKSARLALSTLFTVCQWRRSTVLRYCADLLSLSCTEDWTAVSCSRTEDLLPI